MVTGPATFTVLLLVGICVVVGALILGGGKCCGSGKPGATCPRCRHRNVSQARYCAKCGTTLHA